MSRPKPETQTELNFQFLNTLSMSADEFRPEDLPMGWTHSPAEDSRDWLTKETELAYYNLCANDAVFVSDYIYSDAERYSESTEQYRKCLADVDRRLAAVCDTVIEVSAGQPIIHKGDLCI